MAAHSNILAWRIPWIDEPGRVQSTEVLSHKESDMTEVTEQSFKYSLNLILVYFFFENHPRVL